LPFCPVGQKGSPPTKVYMPKFDFGQILSTPGALEALTESSQSPNEFLDRHRNCDWGDMCEEDRLLNDEAIVDGSRLFSSFKTRNGVKLWVITEAKDDDGVRRATTILLPEEY
jgi:hypothetical protein